MPAYVIAIKEQTLDPEAFKAYAVKGAESFADVEFKALATYGRFEVVEGSPAESVVIVEFPTFEAAKPWHESPKNQEAIALRLACARCRVLIVDGVK